jgi:outer membrane protein TolC
VSPRRQRPRGTRRRRRRGASPPPRPFPKYLHEKASFRSRRDQHRAPQQPATQPPGRRPGPLRQLGQRSYYPEIDFGANVTRQKATTFGGASTFFQTNYGPSASLSWLLLDFGGRSGDIEEARQALFAADWAHNAMLQTVVLDVTSSFYAYGNAKELLVAQEASVAESQKNYDAANERHAAGVATIADVLQAKTALSQDTLALETVRGLIQTIRGQLATAIGVPANIPVEIAELPQNIDVGEVTGSIDALIEEAQRERPDLGAARAEAEKAYAHIGTARSELLPTISAFGSANRISYASPPGVPYRTTYTGGIQLSVPIFDGFRRVYDVRQAEEDAKAARAQAETLEQQVILQVWTSYYNVRTAAQRVQTSRDLLESAGQAADVTAGRYKSGVGSILDLLTSQRNLALARAQDVRRAPTGTRAWHNSRTTREFSCPRRPPRPGLRPERKQDEIAPDRRRLSPVWRRPLAFGLCSPRRGAAAGGCSRDRRLRRAQERSRRGDRYRTRRGAFDGRREIAGQRNADVGRIPRGQGRQAGRSPVPHRSAAVRRHARAGPGEPRPGPRAGQERRIRDRAL